METAPRLNSQRNTYEPGWPPERFIVPLLAAKIPELFKQYCQPSREGATALDVGCGMQPFRRMIEDTDYQYASMDVVQNKSGTVDFIAPLDGPLPAAARDCPPFDFILCTEVMEHVRDWKTAFENFAALLAPGGRVLMTCPHFYPLHEAPYDFWRPTPFAIESFAKNSGLKVILVEQVGGPWEVLGTLLAETHCYPATTRLVDRLAAKLGRVGRKLVNRALLSDWWKSRVVLKGPYFLSVAAILEKPCPESDANRMESLPQSQR